MVNSEHLNDVNTCLHTIYENFAESRSKGIAVRSNNVSYSFEQLNNNANQLAHEIIHTLGKESESVAILIENSYEQVVAILGILKAGKCYIPLDTDFPVNRLLSVIDDAECSMLISTENYRNLAKEVFRDDRTILVDKILTNNHYENPGLKIASNQPALIPYTSGSTGDPKGAIHTHRSIVHLIKRISTMCPVAEDDIVGYFFSVAFSAHALPLFTALLNGCTLTILSIDSNKLTGVLDWLLDEKISIVLMLPSFIRHLTSTMPRNLVIRDLKHLYIGGETLYRSDIEKLRPHIADNTGIINIYASTECYVCCAMTMDKRSVLKSNIIPIGYPVDDVEVEIIDKQGNILGPNKTGTIQIKSKFISPGYRNPELNREVFFTGGDDNQTIIFKTADLAFKTVDGCITHVGREENYIKLRGYRIDLHEIKNILLEIENVKEVACMIKKNLAGAEHIIAYLVPANSATPDIEHAKFKLIRRLPDYMIPTHILSIPELKKLPSGKIDQSKIPDPDWKTFNDRQEFIAPRTDIEASIVEIFETSLKIKPISVANNFLELGADSLSLFLVFNNIEKKFGFKLNLDAVLENPSIETIAKFITDNK